MHQSHIRIVPIGGSSVKVKALGIHLQQNMCDAQKGKGKRFNMVQHFLLDLQPHPQGNLVRLRLVLGWPIRSS